MIINASKLIVRMFIFSQIPIMHQRDVTALTLVALILFTLTYFPGCEGQLTQSLGWGSAGSAGKRAIHEIQECSTVEPSSIAEILALIRVSTVPNNFAFSHDIMLPVCFTLFYFCKYSRTVISRASAPCEGLYLHVHIRSYRGRLLGRIRYMYKTDILISKGYIEIRIQ